MIEAILLVLLVLGVYLSLTRSKSPTARVVMLLSLLGLVVAYLEGHEPESKRGDYPYTETEVHAIGAPERVILALVNAEIRIGEGPGELILTKRARKKEDLLRMRPEVRVEAGTLRITDPHPPRNTAYRVVLRLPRPVKARIAVTNGELRGNDRLDGLELTATNLSLDLTAFAPKAPSRISATNGRIVLKAFAPEADVRASFTNGSVRVEPAGPVRIRVNLTNGAVTYPGGTAKAPLAWGPEDAPRLQIDATNGSVTIEPSL